MKNKKLSILLIIITLVSSILFFISCVSYNYEFSETTYYIGKITKWITIIGSSIFIIMQYKEKDVLKKFFKIFLMCSVIAFIISLIVTLIGPFASYLKEHETARLFAYNLRDFIVIVSISGLTGLFFTSICKKDIFSLSGAVLSIAILPELFSLLFFSIYEHINFGLACITVNILLFLFCSFRAFANTEDKHVKRICYYSNFLFIVMLILDIIIWLIEWIGDKFIRDVMLILLFRGMIIIGVVISLLSIEAAVLSFKNKKNKKR